MVSFLRNTILLAFLVPALCRASETLELARQAARDQLLELAATSYKQVLEEDPPEPVRHQALLELARIRIQLTDSSGAAEILENFPEKASKDLQHQKAVLQANLYQAGGKPGEALEVLESVGPLSGEWEELRRAVQAHCLFEIQGMEAALEVLSFDEEKPVSVPLRITAMNFLVQAGREAEALEGLQELAETAPLSEDGRSARTAMARILLRQQRPEEALRWLDPVLEAGTESVRLELELYPLLIEAFEQQQRYLEAAEAIQAFSVLVDEEDFLVRLKGREAGNRIAGGELEQMDQQLGTWIAQYGDVQALTTAQASLANAWKQRGNLEQAKAAYQRYLSVVTDPALRLQGEKGLADTLVELGQVDEAVVLLKRIRNMLPGEDPEGASILFLLADAELRRGNAEEASTLFAEWVSLYPDHPDLPVVLLRSSEAFSEAGRLPEALNALEEVRQQAPGTELAEKAMLQRALVLGPKRVEQALGAFDAYLEVYPEGEYVADAMTEKGIAAYRLGLFDLAIREFTAVEQKFPEHPRSEQAFCLRGWAHYLKGEDAVARRIGESFLESYPESPFDPDVRVWLAEMAYNRGDYAEAAEGFVVLTGPSYLTPMRARAAYLAGRSYLSAQEVGKALPLFETSLELDADSGFAPEVLFYLGDTLTELDRFDEAIVRFNEVIRTYPDSYLILPALGRIGDCQYTLGEKNSDRYVEALNTYRQVQESPEASRELKLQATYKIGRTLAALGREEEALPYYLEASTSYRAHSAFLPASSSIWFVRSVTDAAQYYESQRQYRDAIKVYRQLASTRLEGAAEAARRIEDLRRQHLILF